MARDIVDHGGSLAMLLRAGEWRSSAYVAYLREHQVEEVNVASLLIDHSESDEKQNVACIPDRRSEQWVPRTYRYLSQVIYICARDRQQWVVTQAMREAVRLWSLGVLCQSGEQRASWGGVRT